MAPELGPAAFFRIDMAVDGLVAYAAGRALVTHAPGDLLGRPASAQAAFDLVAQAGIADQLAPTGPATVAAALRHDAPIATKLRKLTVVEVDALQFAENRRTMPAEAARHLVRAQPCMQPALDLAPVGQGKVRKPNLHSAIRSWLNPLSSIKSRTQK